MSFSPPLVIITKIKLNIFFHFLGVISPINPKLNISLSSMKYFSTLEAFEIQNYLVLTFKKVFNLDSEIYMDLYLKNLFDGTLKIIKSFILIFFKI